MSSVSIFKYKFYFLHTSNAGTLEQSTVRACSGDLFLLGIYNYL